jgi:hypothetical protein
MPELPERLFPARPEMPAELPGLVAAVGDGDAGAVQRVFDLTGKLVGKSDVRGAQASATVADLAESLLDPEDDHSALSDADAAELVNLVRGSNLSDADLRRAMRRFESGLDQPALSDLIFWPKRELSASELVAAARGKKGRELVALLDPTCGIPEERMARAPHPGALAAARRVLVQLVVREQIDLGSGETAAAGLARLASDATSLEEIVARFIEIDGILEVYADDDRLREALESLHSR